MEPPPMPDPAPARRAPVFFEDLSVGRRFATGKIPVDQAQIIEFARSFDPQPFHLDPAAAKETFFGGLAASGWHTAAITMRLLIDGGFPIAGGTIGVNVEVAWPRPVRPGDVLRVEGEIIETAPSKSRSDRGWATMRAETLNQRDEVVQVMTARMVVPRRPG
jgi:acyl dehydratase